MFGPITLPFGAKMLFNTVTLKPGVTLKIPRRQSLCRQVLRPGQSVLRHQGTRL